MLAPGDEPAAAAQAQAAQPAEEVQTADPLGTTGLSGSSSSAPGTLLGAVDVKPDEYYQASEPDDDDQLEETGVQKDDVADYVADFKVFMTRVRNELLLDTLLEEDFTPTEVKDLDVWYGRHELQEQVYSVSYKLTTDDKFLHNTMRSVDASKDGG